MTISDIVAARRPYIDGRWVSGDGPELPVESPADGSMVTTVAAASVDQVGAAIGAARRAFDAGPWPRLAAAERIAMVGRFIDALAARRSLLIETVIAEAGCPRLVTEPAQVDVSVSSSRQLVDLYSRLPEWEHNQAPLSDHFVGSKLRMSLTRYEPVGVVAAISPYNFPLLTNVWKVVPGLLAGCAVVLRPNPLTPLAALVLGEAAEEAELPPGVLNVVAEADSAGAMLLTSDPRVDMVSFTGSTAVGRAVAAQAAPTLKRVILELGGKSVALHLPDALEGGVGGVVGAAMMVFGANSGQGCALQTRILVPEAHRSAVVEALAATVAALPIGDPSAPTTLIGPLITERQRQRVDDLVQRSADAGARVAAGGSAPKSLDRGWFYQPTVLDAPDPDNPGNQEEFFGPVVSVVGYRDIDHAVEIANNSSYGLSGGVYTGDLALGSEVAGRLRSGTVEVNVGWTSGYTPFGGIKGSGYGKELGAAGLRAYQLGKHVVMGTR